MLTQGIGKGMWVIHSCGKSAEQTKSENFKIMFAPVAGSYANNLCLYSTLQYNWYYNETPALESLPKGAFNCKTQRLWTCYSIRGIN